MRDRALLHLLLAAGRSVEALLPDRADEVRSVCDDLAVTRIARGRFELTWSDGTTTRRLDVDGANFTWYRRGDLASRTSARPADLDDRAGNWAAAHEVWAELLGLPPHRLAPTSRTFPVEGSTRLDRSDHPALDVGPLAVAGAMVAVATWGTATAPAPLLAGAGLGYVAATSDDARRVAGRGLGGAIAGAVVALLVRIGPEWVLDRPAVAGAGLVVAASRVQTARRTPGGTWPVSTALALAVGAVAAPASGPGWWTLAGTLLVADVVAAMVRGRADRAGRILTTGLMAAGFGTSLALLGHHTDPVAPVPREPALLLAAAVLLACGAATAAHGCRDRLAGWLAPPLLGSALLVAVARSSTVSVGLAAAGVVAAAAVGTGEAMTRHAARRAREARRRPVFAPPLKDRPAPTPRPPVGREASTPVTAPSRRTVGNAATDS